MTVFGVPSNGGRSGPGPTTPCAHDLVTVSFVVPALVGAVFADLVAEFLCWTPLPMQRRADGSFCTQVRLERDHRWHYRFLVDGDRWINDLEAEDYVVNPDGCAMSVVTT